MEFFLIDIFQDRDDASSWIRVVKRNFAFAAHTMRGNVSSNVPRERMLNYHLGDNGLLL